MKWSSFSLWSNSVVARKRDAAVVRVIASASERFSVMTLFTLFAFIALSNTAQSQTVSKETERTTLSGVYTNAQAARGKNVYATFCRSCHAPETHTGVTFQNHWADKKLSDLFFYMSEKMPKNDPGGLQPSEYADVMTYILKMNAMPAGKMELKPDSTLLDSVRIVMVKKKPPQKRPANKE